MVKINKIKVMLHNILDFRVQKTWSIGSHRERQVVII